MSKEEATPKKTEATTKKTEVKEEGATLSVHYKDFQQNRRTKIAIIVVIAVIVLAASAAGFLTCIEPPVPRFMLVDLSLDPVSDTKVLVKLLSINPSFSSLYYSKMSVHVRIEDIFKTERVYLQGTLQEPHERTTWTGVIARNNVKNEDGTFQIRDGVRNGDVIADVKIRKKNWFLTRRLFVTCPVSLNLRDLTAATPKPMSTCQVL